MYVAYINFNYGFFNKLYYHVNKSVSFKISLPNKVLNPEIEKLKKEINSINEKLTIKNENYLKTFKSNNNNILNHNASDKQLIILVQVHNRIIYLKELINSLSKVKFINETLLIFSHDYYDKNINNLIGTINFTAVSFFGYWSSSRTFLNSLFCTLK